MGRIGTRLSAHEETEPVEWAGLPKAGQPISSYPPEPLSKETKMSRIKPTKTAPANTTQTL